MNIFANARRLPPVAALMAMAALLPWNARPADKLPVLGDSKAAQGSKPAQKEQAAKPDPGGFDLIISDGMITWNGMKVKIEPTLGHVVDTLRERYAEANIAISPGLSELRVGDLKLRARNLPEELEAIRVASGSPSWGGRRGGGGAGTGGVELGGGKGRGSAWPAPVGWGGGGGGGRRQRGGLGGPFPRPPRL